MKKNHIRVGGADYAAALTGGALMRFKQAAGYDFLKDPERLDTEGLIVLAWASAVSVARRDGTEFNLTADELADRMSLEEVNGLAEWLRDQTQPDGEPSEDEKKKKKAATA